MADRHTRNADVLADDDGPGAFVDNEKIEIECFDGTQKIIQNSAVPLLDERGAVEGAIIVNEDITTQEEDAETLRRAKREVEDASRYLEAALAVPGVTNSEEAGSSWSRCSRSSPTPSTRWPTSAAGGCTRSGRWTCFPTPRPSGSRLLPRRRPTSTA